ncbi:MAG TPA: VanZ family protein [Thiobacillaceae bacterium]|nr:VanZ family protein [Thiobacillaceae bacterium]
MPSVRPTLLVLALLYLVFVIYGSLVPLHFHPQPWTQAVTRFRAIPYLNLGIGSRADWVANILLFIPLAFFWLGALWSRGFLSRSLFTLAVLVAGLALSVGIEFTQIFFPPRTVSLNDIIAECIGTVIGVVGWWVLGGKLSRWYVDWRSIKEPATFAERLAWAYVAAVFIYGVLPLDLTISAVEIFHKWREGKLNLIPFATLPSEPSLAIYALTMDALMWAPPAFFWQISGKRSSLRAWAMTIGGAALLEVLQLFVYSRVTDVTEVITAALGGAVGVLLGAKYVSGLRPSKEMKRTAATSDIFKTLLPLALALLWMFGLAVLFWYPFHFRTDGAFLRERLHSFLTRVPFEAYYYGTEYRAATEVLHKVLFFIPLGAMLAWFVSQLRWTWRGLVTFLSLALIACTAVAIELGRLALPEKNPDSMDIILQWLGGAVGFVSGRLILSRKLLAGKSPKAHSSNLGRLIRSGQRVPQGSRGKA